MNSFSFSDADLRKAAGSVRDSMLQELSASPDHAHIFTDAFKQKIQPLFIKDQHRRTMQKILRRIAAVFLAILIGIGTWLAVTPSARAAVLDWIREIYEDSIIYWFINLDTSSALPEYVPTWLPDGYHEVDIYEDESMRNLFYQNETKDSNIVFEYFILTENSTGHLEFLYDVDDLALESVDINGIIADYYPAGGASNTHNLIWIDETQNIVFLVHSDLGKEILIRIAENIILISK